MAHRLRFSARALREIGEARAWYEAQSSGLAPNPSERQRRHKKTPRSSTLHFPEA